MNVFCTRARRLLWLGALACLSAASGQGVAASRPAHTTDERIVLPTSVSPDHYRIEITPDAAQLSFVGSTEIDLNVHEPVDHIVLNSADLVIDEARIDGDGARLAVSYDVPHQTAAIALASTVGVGAHTLHLSYHGRIYQQSSGLFALDYGPAADRHRALFTQFEVTDARRFVPCWDEPASKATFDLSAVVPEAQMAVSNMPVNASELLGGGLKRVRFATTPKMSSYLLFFALGDFERQQRTVDGVEVGVIFKRGDAQRARFALDAAADLLPYYNDYFGVRFPLPKLDLIAGPGESAFFGAMENWGAIFSFERDLLIDPRFATEHDRQNVYSAIAHEMAHQWFGDLVTMQWWTELWLNEGFASWMEHKAADHFHPEWHMWLQFAQSRQRAMELDARAGTHPIIQPVKDAQLAGAGFDAISYSKGAAVIRSLESYGGEEAFRAGVRRYMREHAYGNTVTDQFWSAIDRETSRPITPIAHDMTLQVGVPMISEQRAACIGEHTELVLTQGRYSVDTAAGSGGSWHVPVAARTLGAATVTRLVTGPSPHAIRLPGCGPVIINAAQGGYFRSRYTDAGLAALSAHYPELAPEDQLGLLQDTQSLAYAGTMTMGAFFDLVDAVPANSSPEILSTLADALRSLDLLSSGLPLQADYRRWARGRLEPVLQTIGTQRQPGEADNVALLRSGLLDALSQMDDAAVIEAARQRFQQLRSDNVAVDAEQRRSTLKIVAQHADQASWNQLHEMARAAATDLEREQIYALLVEADDPGLVQQALELALAGEPPPTLAATIFVAAAVRHPRQVTEFAIAQWDRLKPMIEPEVGGRLVTQLARSAWDPALIDEVARFANAEMPAQARGEMLKTAAAIRWHDRIRSQRLPSAEQWLRTHAATAAGAH
jgi:aminopeptidase N